MTAHDVRAADRGSSAYSDAFPSAAQTRVLVFADALGASQQIAFVEGLSGARGRGDAAVRIVEEEAFGEDIGLIGLGSAASLAAEHFNVVQPTVVVLSRFGHGAGAQAVLDLARAQGLPIVFHIDDDLYEMPPVVGTERHRAAHHPRRVMALSRVLIEADLVMAATEPLALKLGRLAGHGRIGWLENGTAGTPRPRPDPRPDADPIVVGYMGSATHGPDLEMAIPALTAAMQKFPGLRVELLGSISRQPVADQLPSSVVRRDVVAGDYSDFKRTLAGLGWHIGLAPLLTTPYNRFKTATKWAEYAEAGIATLASDVEVYRPMIESGAAAGAGPQQWPHVLDLLIGSDELRRAIVEASDRMLATRFSWTRLEDSVLHLLRLARSRTA
jgi:hypothetical protein